MKTLLAFFLLALPVIAGEVHTPKVGSKERTDILNAVRDPLEDQIHQKVIFRVSHLKVQDGWAFLIAQPRTRDDKPIDYTGTIFEWGTKEFDESAIAILRFKRNRGYIVQHSFFTSDVWWEEAPKELRAPRGIFKLSEIKP